MKPQGGTGSIYQRGAMWWMKYSQHGRPIRESAHTKNRQVAERKLAKRIAEIENGTFAGPQLERIRIEELAEDFLRDYRVNGLKSLDDAHARWELHLKPFFGRLRAVQLTSTLLSQYVDKRQQAGASNATINRELSALGRMFSLGAKAEPPKVLRIPHFPRLTENGRLTGFLEDGQFSGLVEGAELWFRTLVECGRTYGWRVSELLNLKVRQVDTTDRVIRLDTSKNGDPREAVMSTAVHVLLSECIFGKAAEDYVFTRPGGAPVRDFRATWWNACVRAGLGRWLCKNCGTTSADGLRCAACKAEGRRHDRLKWAGLLFHDLRRTAARNLRRAGVPESLIMDIGGWRTNSIFRRYAIINRNDHRDAMLKLEQSQEQPPESGHAGHNLGTVAPETVQLRRPN